MKGKKGANVVGDPDNGGDPARETWVGLSGVAYSGFLCHGTSVARGLEILVKGHILPSSGICGKGVYGIQALMAIDVM